MTISARFRNAISRILVHALKPTLTLALVMALSLASSAQTYRAQILHTFHGNDGAFPAYGNLIQDSKGNLYGATQQGGGGQGCGTVGCGTIFKLDTSGKETVVYRFSIDNGNGTLPNASLIQDAAGNLYGTTLAGGSGNYGTIFKVSKDGKETILFNFNNTGGANPNGGLVMDASGKLYGTTAYGGDTSCINYQGCGVVFELDTAGNETVLLTFALFDGATPYGSLVLDKSGNLYGTTVAGGRGSCGGPDCGTVFKVNEKGFENVLYAFQNVEGDGYNPVAGVVRDAKGNLYGTTPLGGGSGFGTVFKVTLKGKEIVLHNFAGTPGGANPSATLIFDLQGNLYGTTFDGGPSDDGIVFKVDPAGKETTLHAFSGSDGAYPEAGLLRDKKGNLYGTTTEGGDFSCNPPYGCGVVFKLIPK